MSRAFARAAAGLIALLVATSVFHGVASAQAPVSTDAALSASTAAAAPAFGVQFHGLWDMYDDAARAKVLDQLATSGATWVRVDMSWAMIQPTSRDSYDMAWGVPFVDHVLSMVTARGLKPLVTLWLTPSWANGGAGERTLPADPADYARAARWAAARWAGTVPAWEIWNEPNDNDFLVGASAVQYTALLKTAYPAIKAGNPAAQVVFGGPNQNDGDWIAACYAAGAAGSFDVMATHPYQAVANLQPEAADDGTRYRFTHLAAVHALMAQHGDGNKEIWATEFGWSSHANVGGEENWVLGVTREQQADYAVRALRLVASSMPYVTHLFWYTDHDFTDVNLQNSNYGIFDTNLNPKPVFYALQSYLKGAAQAPSAPLQGPTLPVDGASSSTTPSRDSAAAVPAAPVVEPVTPVASGPVPSRVVIRWVTSRTVGRQAALTAERAATLHRAGLQRAALRRAALHRAALHQAALRRAALRGAALHGAS